MSDPNLVGILKSCYVKFINAFFMKKDHNAPLFVIKTVQKHGKYFAWIYFPGEKSMTNFADNIPNIHFAGALSIGVSSSLAVVIVEYVESVKQPFGKRHESSYI